MKRVAIVGALLASLLAGTAAMASPHDRGDSDHREPPRSQHDEHRVAGRDNYRPAPRVLYRAPVRYGMYHRPSGYYQHSWRNGERLPAAYYQRPYVIGNYRDCGLRVPPRGYQWVRVNGDAVLAGIATGIVLDSVFHIFG